MTFFGTSDPSSAAEDKAAPWLQKKASAIPWQDITQTNRICLFLNLYDQRCAGKRHFPMDQTIFFGITFRSLRSTQKFPLDNSSLFC